MVSSSVSSKKSVGGILGGVFSHGFSIPEWFVLEMVESTHITTSCRGGSTDTDSDVGVVRLAARTSGIGASSILLAYARVRG